MWKRVNINLMVILLFMEVCIMLNLCGCGKKISTENFYANNQENLEKIVLFLKENNNIKEITKERPWLSEYNYSKCGNIYYITKTKDKIEESDSTNLIKEIMRQIVYIFPNYDNDNFTVSFQTISKFGEGEELIYTETGEELQDKYLTVEKWLSDHWYIARS